MDEGYTFPIQDAHKRTVSLRLVAMVVLAAFLLGVIATWVMTRDSDWSTGSLFRLRSEETPASPASPGVAAVEPGPAATIAVNGSAGAAQEARQAVQRVEQVEEQTGGIDQRLAALEQRLTRLDLQSQAAMGNAARAEGLLVAFASRRAIERGTPLGFLEDQLRLRFGDARPNAVQTVIDAASEPVTLDQLMTRLDGLAPILTDAPEKGGILSWLSNELSQLVVVRTDDTPSPVAERRLERARIYLETGRIEFAISEIRNMPNAASAADWLRDAERFAAAQRALEVLETAAILEPRELRNASGERVEQPSPLSENRAG